MKVNSLPSVDSLCYYHYLNFIIKKSERFVGVLFISISLSKSHYHIKLFARGKNEGLVGIFWYAEPNQCIYGSP